MYQGNRQRANPRLLDRNVKERSFLSHFGASFHILQYENHLRRSIMSRRNCSSDYNYDRGCGCGSYDGGCGFGSFGGNCTGCFSCCDYSCVLSSIYNVYTLQYLASILRTFLGCGLCGGNTGFGCGGGCGSNQCGGGCGCGGCGGCGHCDHSCGGCNCGCCVTTTC